VSPRTALGVGLKVDADALPRGVKKQLRRGQVDLDDPATTLALLRADAVVGVKGVFGADGALAVDRASSARSATRPSTTRSRPASGVGSTAGRTAT
jgi:hypothetical protein